MGCLGTTIFFLLHAKKGSHSFILVNVSPLQC